MKLFRLKYGILVLLAMMAIFASAKKKENVEVPAPYAWTMSNPLGLRYAADIDTLYENYHDAAIPSFRSRAYATTGNYGSPGQDQIFFDRRPTSAFFHEDALSTWLPSVQNHRFYNSRIPITLLSHTTGGDKYSNQDRTTLDFSGNVNKRLSIGACLDYIYSKGSYENQAHKNFVWKGSASYLGDRYELQAVMMNYNLSNKENGGIVDDRYITDPAEVQGGETKVNPKDILTRLTAAQSGLTGHQVVMNHRYKVGYYKYKRDSIADTIVSKTYIPVTSFIWNLDYKINSHKFINESGTQGKEFFPHTYLNAEGTDEFNRYWHLRNTLGISLLEGFNKYAKFGFALYAQHEIRRYTQVADSVSASGALPEGVEPLPCTVEPRTTENLMYVGGSLTKQQGAVLTYNAEAKFGVLGDVAGDVEAVGDIAARIRLFGDTVVVKGYGYFKNVEAPFLMKHFISNHYAWSNDFGKETRFRVGGELNIPWTATMLNVGYETLKNYLYFGENGTPEQCSSPVHVLSATLKQHLRFGILNWDNECTYQTSSNEQVLALPKFALYSNLFIKFAVAKVLKVQLGADANYYTKYYAPAYNPALMNFHNQQEVKCGNFAFINVYANFRMKQARFYVAYTHANKGSFGGNNYFSTPHYPLNPARFQIGVSVNFTN